jgi:hypothetical protein
MSEHEIHQDLAEKEFILKYMDKTDITSVDGVGRVMAEYYTDRTNLLTHVKAGKALEGASDPPKDEKPKGG